jgi:hypothetical protein
MPSTDIEFRIAAVTVAGEDHCDAQPCVSRAITFEDDING